MSHDAGRPRATQQWLPDFKAGKELTQAEHGRQASTVAALMLTLDPTNAVSARLRIGPISQMPSVGSVKRNKSAMEAVGAASTTIPDGQHTGRVTTLTAQATTPQPLLHVNVSATGLPSRSRTVGKHVSHGVGDTGGQTLETAQEHRPRSTVPLDVGPEDRFPAPCCAPGIAPSSTWLPSRPASSDAPNLGSRCR